jgi:hypothetical protein
MHRRTPALFLVALLAVGASATARAAVILTTIGSPTFVPTDFHVFAAPFGTATSGYAEFNQTQEALLPPPNHIPVSGLGIGPGAPHAGPYDQEIGQGVAANGFVESTTFTTAQYSNGVGVFLAFMLVPGAGSPIGPSPDFASGPTLPDPPFPLMIDGRTLTNGTVNDVLAQPFTVPALDTITGFAGLNHSHIPLFFGDNIDFATRLVTGSYEYQISILDVNGNGYLVTAPFELQAVPEPPTWIMTGVGSLAIVGLALRRRRGSALQS